MQIRIPTASTMEIAVMIVGTISRTAVVTSATSAAAVAVTTLRRLNRLEIR